MDNQLPTPKKNRFTRRERMTVLLWAFYLTSIAFIPKEAHMALTALLCVVPLLRRNRLNPALAPYVLPLVTIVIPATLVTAAFGEFGWVSVKSFAYIIRIPVYLVFGYLFCPKEKAALKIMLASTVSGVVLAIYYLIDYAMIGGDLSSRFDIRQTVGFGYSVWAPALCAAAYFIVVKKFSFFKKLIFALSIILICASIFLSDSRTLLIGVFLTLICMMRLFPLRLVSGAIMAAMIVIVIGTTPLLFHFVPERDIIHMEPNFPRSLREIMPLDRGTDSEINEFWRGHEARQVFKYMDKVGSYTYVVGAGLHAEVKIYLERYGYLTSIDAPVFHNAIAFLLLRGGYFGVLMYTVQLVMLGLAATYVCKQESDPVSVAFARMMVGLLFVCVATTPTTSGLLNYGEGGSTFGSLFGIVLFRFIKLKTTKTQQSAQQETKYVAA